MSFLSTIGSFSESLERGIQRAQPHLESWAQKQYEHGAMEAMQGNEAPDGYYAIKAYETTLGELTAKREFKHELEDYFLETGNVTDPEEFQAGLERISEEFLEGQTDNFLQGFVPNAMGFEAQILSKFRRGIQEEQIKKNFAVIDQNLQEEMDLFLDAIVAQEYKDTTGYTSMEELAGGDIRAERNFLNQSHVRENINRGYRDILTQAQERGEAMNIKKRDVNDMFFQFVKRKAVKGYPELLDTLFEVDEDGISLASAIGMQKVLDTKERAEHMLEQRLNRTLTEAEKAQMDEDTRQAQAKMLNFYQDLGAIQLSDDPLEIDQMTKDLQENYINDDEFMLMLNETRGIDMIKEVTDSYLRANEERERIEQARAEDLDQHRTETLDSIRGSVVGEIFNAYKLPTKEARIQRAEEIEDWLNTSIEDSGYSFKSTVRDSINSDLLSLRNYSDEDVRNDLDLYGDYLNQIRADRDPLGLNGRAQLNRDVAQGLITQTTAEQLLKWDAELQKELEAGEHIGADRSLIMSSVNAMSSMLVADQGFAGTIFGDDEQVAEMIGYFNSWWGNYVEDNDGKRPTFNEFEQEMDSMLKFHGTTLQEMYDRAGVNPDVERDTEALEQDLEPYLELSQEQHATLGSLEAQANAETWFDGLISKLPFTSPTAEAQMLDMLKDLNIDELDRLPTWSPAHISELLEQGDNFESHVTSLEQMRALSERGATDSNGNLLYTKEEVDLYYFSHLTQRVAPKINSMVGDTTNIWELNTIVKEELEKEGFSDEWLSPLVVWMTKTRSNNNR